MTSSTTRTTYSIPPAPAKPRSRRVYLVAIEDSCVGEVGLVVERSWAHTYTDGYVPHVARNGQVIAHDLLEHPNGKVTGTIDNEMEALGGLLFVRGHRAFGFYSVEQSLAADMTRMYNEWTNCQAPFDTRKHTAKVPDCPAWSRIEDVLSETYYALKKEHPDDGGYRRGYSFKTFAQCLRYHMAKGYNAASKRFDDSSWNASVLFDAIHHALNRAVNFHALQEGQRFLLTFDDATASCREVGGY
jgi:hypothetical protein